MARSIPTVLQVILRVLAALLGGYGFVWGFMSLGIAASVALGVGYEDTQTLFNLLAVLLFVVCFCWAFVVRKLVRAWALLAGGGALMTLAAWLLGRALV